MPEEIYISVAEAAALLDITENAVRKRIHRDTLPAIKEGRDWRILLSDLGTDRIIDLGDQEVERQGVHGDTPTTDQLRDTPEDAPTGQEGVEQRVQEGDSEPESVPLGDSQTEASSATELRLAEQQLAIFVAQFVLPKDQRIADLERQIGRLEVESELLASERASVRQLERENGRLSERIHQLEGAIQERDTEDDRERDTPSWWQFWKWGVAGQDNVP